MNRERQQPDNQDQDGEKAVEPPTCDGMADVPVATDEEDSSSEERTR